MGVLNHFFGRLFRHRANDGMRMPLRGVRAMGLLLMGAAVFGGDDLLGETYVRTPSQVTDWFSRRDWLSSSGKNGLPEWTDTVIVGSHVLVNNGMAARYGSMSLSSQLIVATELYASWDTTIWSGTSFVSGYWYTGTLANYGNINISGGLESVETHFGGGVVDVQSGGAWITGNMDMWGGTLNIRGRVTTQSAIGVPSGTTTFSGGNVVMENGEWETPNFFMGGGIASLSMTNSTFTSTNTAIATGGGYGTIVVNGGTFRAGEMALGGYGHATMTFSESALAEMSYLGVAGVETSSLTISGSSVLRTTQANFGQGAKVSVNGASLMVDQYLVNYGELEMTSGGIQALSVSQYGKLTISGGSLVANSLYMSGEISLTGGEVSGWPFYFQGGTLDINGGTLSAWECYLSAGTTTLRSGAMWTGSFNIGAWTQEVSQFTISGGTFSADREFNVGTHADATVTVSGLGVARIVNGGGTAMLASGTAAATLSIGDGGQAGDLQAAEVHGGSGKATVNFNHTGLLNFAPKLSGTMAVNKLGSGTTTLTGSNSYAGKTNVSGGLLKFVNEMPFTDDVTLRTGGLLGFGSTPRVTTIAGDLNVTSSGGVAVTVNGTGAGQFDQVAVDGDFTLTTGVVDVKLGYTPAAGDSYKIFANGGPGSGHFGVKGALPGSLAWTTNSLAETGELGVAELSTWTGGSSGAWDSAENWSNGIPTSTVSALIAHDTVVTPHDAEYLDLFIGGTSSSNVELFTGNLNGTSTYIAYDAGTRASVTRYYGTWTNANEFVVGEFGSGTLSLSGAQVNDRMMIVGAQQGSEGTVFVGSSTLSHSDSLVVGRAGAGAVKLGDSVMTSERATIGLDAGSNGSVLVQDSTWQVAKDLVVGGSGTGSLAISTGYIIGRNVARGLITSDSAVIGAKAGGNGTVQIDGGTWNTAKSVVVGDAGVGALNVAGGLVAAADLAVGRTGTGSVVVSSGGTLSVANGVTVGESGDGLLRLITGGKVIVGGGSGTLVLAQNAGSHGRLDLGQTLYASDGAPYAYLSSGILSAAEVSGGAGEAVVNFGSYLSGTFAPRLTGSLSVEKTGDGLWGSLMGGATVLGGTNSYTGTTGVAGGTLLIMGDNSAATGDVVVTGGVLGGSGTVGGNIFVTGTLPPSSSSTARVAKGSNSVVINGASGTTSIGSGGTLSGTTTIGLTMDTRGRLAPGQNGPGVFTALQDVTIAPGGVLALDFSGTSTGLFDQIWVGGTFTLAGALSLAVNYEAQEGDSFLVFTNGGYDAGTFTLETNLGNGLVWNTSALASAGVLSIEAKSAIWQKTGTSSWNIAANWSGSSLPTNLTNAAIENGGVATMVKGVSGMAKALYLGHTEGGRGSVVVSGGSLTTARASIGDAVASSGTVTVISGTWTNAGDLVVGASGTGVLAIVDQGVVTVAGGSGTVTVARDAGSKGIFQFTGSKSNPTLRAAEVTGGLGTALANIDVSGSMAFAPKLTGSLAVTKLGKGTLTLLGGSSYNGGTTLAAGILNINGANAIGTGALTFSGSSTINNTSGTAVTLAANNAQNWNANFAFAGSNDLNLGTGAVAMSGSRILTVSAKTLGVGGVISGTGSLTKAGAGALTLSGSNTYSGGTVLQAGTLNLGHARALGSGPLNIAGVSTLNNTSGAALTLADHAEAWNANFTFSGSNDLNLGAGAVALTGARTVTVNAGKLTVGGVIDGAKGALTKAGAGTLVLTGSNTYGGATTISAGTLQLGANGSISALSKLTNNGVLAFNQSTDKTFANAISGKGAVVQAGTNRLTLTGTNGYSGGTVIDSGVLVLGNAKALGTGDVTTTGGTLELRGQNVTVSGLSGTGGVIQNGHWGTDASLTVNMKTSGTYGGAITDNGIIPDDEPPGPPPAPPTARSVVSPAPTPPAPAALAFTKAGNGTLVLTARNTYSGTTTVAAGTLQLGNGGTTGSIAGNVTNNGVLAFNRSDSVSFGGAISGKGSVKQLGSGTLTLTGSNSFAGGFMLNDGEVRAGSANALGTGAVTLNDGVLGTDGMQHQINVNNLTWVSDAHIALTLSTTLAESESVVVKGKLTLSGKGKFTFDLSADEDLGTSGSYLVMTVAGGFGKLTASSFAYTTDDGLDGMFRIAGNQLFFDAGMSLRTRGLAAGLDASPTMGAGPEPTTWALVAAGVVLGWILSRRRNGSSRASRR